MMQTVVVGVIVLLAAAFIGQRILAAVRSARGAKAGCSDCGCGTTSSTKADWSKS